MLTIIELKVDCVSESGSMVKSMLNELFRERIGEMKIFQIENYIHEERGSQGMCILGTASSLICLECKMCRKRGWQ